MITKDNFLHDIFPWSMGKVLSSRNEGSSCESVSNLLLMWKCLFCGVAILLDKHAWMVFQGSCQTSTKQLLFGWKGVVRVFVNAVNL